MSISQPLRDAGCRVAAVAGFALDQGCKLISVAVPESMDPRTVTIARDGI